MNERIGEGFRDGRITESPYFSRGEEIVTRVAKSGAGVDGDRGKRELAEMGRKGLGGSRGSKEQSKVEGETAMDLYINI